MSKIRKEIEIAVSNQDFLGYIKLKDKERFIRNRIFKLEKIKVSYTK